jgi:RNA exonuclease 1
LSTDVLLTLPNLVNNIDDFQMTVTRLYEQFLRIYEPLSDRTSLAHHHAAKQERDIHENSVNQAGYKQTAAGVLGRLKKRVPAADNDDVGIDGEWTDKQLQNERSGISSGLRKYILSEAQLADMSYPLPNALDIPQSKESPIGLEHQCDRCGKPFIVKDVLSKQDMELCRYHHGRLRKIKIHGRVT